MESEKRNKLVCITKQKPAHSDRQQTGGDPRGNARGRARLGGIRGTNLRDKVSYKHIWLHVHTISHKFAITLNGS